MTHIHFWNITDALEAKGLLESQHPSIEFYGEQNEIYEEEEEEINMEEIIEKEIEESETTKKEEEKVETEKEEKTQEKIKET